MQLSPAILAGLLPLAGDVVRKTSSLVQPIGDGFAGALRNLFDKEPIPQDSAVVEPEYDSHTSNGESLGEFAARLRDWLRISGAPDSLDLALTVDHLDQIHVDAFGPNSHAVESLLQSNPHWSDQLRSLILHERTIANSVAGSTIQFLNTAGRSTVRLQISDDRIDIDWQ